MTFALGEVTPPASSRQRLIPKRAGLGLGVGLCAEPRKIRRRYSCIIGVTSADTSVDWVLM